MTSPKITCDFRIGTEKYARRSWWAAPRVGDHVILGAGKNRFPADHNGDAMFLIVQATWGAESPQEASCDRQTVILHIKHVPY